MTAVKKANDDLSKLITYAMDIVTKASGNVFTEQHHFLIETKIRKRMMDLEFTDPDSYFAFLKKNADQENQYFISELTTHYTFFFREFRHFEYLQLNLANIINNVRERGSKSIKILCLACSRGQEPYSLAMFFNHHLKEMGVTDISFEILGTDVDKASVAIAENGVYKFQDIKSVPMKYLGDHWQRGKGKISEFVKIKDTIKKHCKFRYGNLMELDKELSEKYDIIFCRNVFIYFTEDQVKKISSNILNYLDPKGLFFTGVSESLSAMNLPVDIHGASIYSHPQVKEVENVQELVVSEKTAQVPHKANYVELPETLKVLCVDDSKIILQLLKKIFGSTPGYEVVGTAENGQEAEEFLKNNKVDVMTLDIHMPVMDGLTYLKKNYNQSHPPVVIVSSVSREDAFKAMEGLKMGASDYIEKPSLEDFAIKGDEICTKLRVAALEKITGHSTTVFTDIDREFQAQELENAENCFYTVYGHYTDRKKIQHVLKELNADNTWPATFLLFEGSGNVLDSIIEDLSKELPQIKFKAYENGSNENETNTVYVGDFKNDFQQIYVDRTKMKSSSILLGHHSQNAANLYLELKVPNLLLDDVNFRQKSNHSKLQELAIDSGPFTSFAYQAKHFIIKG